MKKLLKILFLLIWSINANAQLVNQQWVVRFASDTSIAFVCNINDMALDKNGSILIAGLSADNNTNFQDGFIAKIINTGSVSWFDIYNTNCNYDLFYSVAVDDSANVFVSGRMGTLQSASDFAVLIKYDSGGIRQLMDTTRHITSVDNVTVGQGSVVSLISNFNITLVKYTGNTIDWVVTNDTLIGNNQFINIDTSNNIYVVGTRGISMSDVTFYVKKFDSNGNFLWHSEYNPTSQIDVLEDVKVDKSGNVYLSGRIQSQAGYATAKFNTHGVLVWDNIYNPNVASAGMTSIDVDQMGNVYVAGRYQTINSTLHNCRVVKYDSIGVLQWVAIFDTAYSAITDIVVSKKGNIYVTYMNRSPNLNVSVCRLSPVDGSLIWRTNYNGINDLKDEPVKLMVDSMECIYIACKEAVPGGAAYATVVKYCQTVGINENDNSSNILSIYPNPATTQVTLQPQQPLKNANVWLYNTLGEVVIQHQNIKGEKITIKTNELPVGIYFITVLDEDKTYTCKLIIE